MNRVHGMIDKEFEGTRSLHEYIEEKNSLFNMKKKEYVESRIRIVNDDLKNYDNSLLSKMYRKSRVEASKSVLESKLEVIDKKMIEKSFLDKMISAVTIASSGIGEKYMREAVKGHLIEEGMF